MGKDFVKIKKQPAGIPATEIFTIHPHGGYFSARREHLFGEWFDGHEAKVFVYKFSHVEIISKKTEIIVRKEKGEKHAKSQRNH